MAGWCSASKSLDQKCPECGGIMLFDMPTKRFGCKSCGLFLTRDQLSDIRYKQRTPIDDERRKKTRQQSDYLEWWLSGDKEH
jgi:ribosomal protein S27AE